MCSAKNLARFSIHLVAGCVLVWTLAGSTPVAGGEESKKKKLTAREIFYAAPPVEKPVQTVEPVKPVKPVKTEVAKAQSPAKTQPAVKGPIRGPEQVAGGVTVGQGARIVQAAYTPPIPLGLRYSILKRAEAGQSVEVDPQTAFRAGDKIRISVEVNDTGYLYIVNLGSSGAWKVLFPSPEIEGGDNLVKRGQRYEIPAGYTFTFDEQPGVEKLFVVVSRRPEPDLEKLIYSLSGRPREAPSEEEKPKLLLAQNLGPIDDRLIGRLRNSYARDLIIEKVDENMPGPKQEREKAVYTVNPKAGADSRVVADISLNHQ